MIKSSGDIFQPLHLSSYSGVFFGTKNPFSTFSYPTNRDVFFALIIISEHYTNSIRRKLFVICVHGVLIGLSQKELCEGKHGVE